MLYMRGWTTSSLKVFKSLRRRRCDILGHCYVELSQCASGRARERGTKTNCFPNPKVTIDVVSTNVGDEAFESFLFICENLETRQVAELRLEIFDRNLECLFFTKRRLILAEAPILCE